MNTRNAEVLRIPYPYRAMLSICSDLDETRTAQDYFGLMQSLSCDRSSSRRRGYGLEVGNTIYFGMPKDQFSYWNSTASDRRKIQRLIKSGHIDCIHSFGDLVRSRDEVKVAIDELVRHGCFLKVWIDHAIAPTNLGSDVMQGSGDICGSQAFHSDLLPSYGIRYVWTGRVTSCFGQDVPRNLLRILDSKFLRKSPITFAKEAAKIGLAHLGSAKYGMHRDNALTRSINLNSGHMVTEFIRSNPHPEGVSVGETMDGIGDVLTDANLDWLVKSGSLSVIYTHLGKTRNRSVSIPTRSAEAFDRLAKRFEDDEILVTTTSRLLDYRWLSHSASISELSSCDTFLVNVDVDKGIPLDGLSIRVPMANDYRFIVNGKNVTFSVTDAPKDSQSRVAYIPWQFLSFPDLSDADPGLV